MEAFLDELATDIATFAAMAETFIDWCVGHVVAFIGDRIGVQ